MSANGGAGVRGTSENKDHIGVVGENIAGGLAGEFFGDVSVTGKLFVAGQQVQNTEQLQSQVNTLVSQVSTLQSQVGTLQAQVIELQGKVSVLQSEIGQ